MTILHTLTVGELNAPPVVFLHGFLGCGADWAEIMAALAADFFCVAPDLPGHGQPIGDGDIGWTDSAESLLHTLDALHLTPAALVGYSLGGRLALYLALRHPERFTGLLLESASPGLRSPAEQAARRASDERLALELEQGDFDAFLERWYRQPLFAGLAQHPRFARAQQLRRSNDPRALARALRGLSAGAQPTLWREWPDCRLPVWLVAGEADEKYVEISAEMSRLNPAAHRHILPGCSHNTHLQAPDAFLAVLRPFLLACARRG